MDSFYQILELSRTVGLNINEEAAANASALACLRVFGHQLPTDFLRWCYGYPNHAGWPHMSTWEGILSPIGRRPSLEERNRMLRSDGSWPSHLVSFFVTDDGDYCFDFSKGQKPEIGYVDHWANPDSSDRPVVDSETLHSDFVAWFAEMTAWVKQQ